MTDAPTDSGAAGPGLPRRVRATARNGVTCATDLLTGQDAEARLARPPAELIRRVKDGLLDASS